MSDDKNQIFTPERLGDALKELGQIAYEAGSRHFTCGTNAVADAKGLPMKRPDTLAEVAARVSAGAAFRPTLSEFLDEFYDTKSGGKR